MKYALLIAALIGANAQAATKLDVDNRRALIYTGSPTGITAHLCLNVDEDAATRTETELLAGQCVKLEGTLTEATVVRNFGALILFAKQNVIKQKEQRIAEYTGTSESFRTYIAGHYAEVLTAIDALEPASYFAAAQELLTSAIVDYETSGQMDEEIESYGILTQELK